MFKKYLENTKKLYITGNINAYYLITIFKSFWFVEAIWFFYWSKFMSFSEVALFFSLMSIVSLLAEVPTGVFADKFGRKKSVLIGVFLLFLSVFLEVIATNKWWLAGGGFVGSIGGAFISGSLEALVYDDLLNRGKEYLYEKIAAFKTQIAYVAYGFGVIIGGLLFSYNFRLAHAVWAASLFMAFLFSWFLREVKIKTNSIIQDNLLNTSIIGFEQLFTKQLRPYILLCLIITSMFYLYDWGMSKPAIAVNFGFYAKEQGFIYALMAGANILAIGAIPYFRKKFHDLKGLSILNILMGVGFVLAFLKLGIIGIFPLLIIEMSGNISEPWISSVVNNNIDSSFRATTLSTLQLLSKFPYMIVNYFVGVAIDGKFVNELHLMLGLILVTFAIINYLYVKPDKNII